MTIVASDVIQAAGDDPRATATPVRVRRHETQRFIPSQGVAHSEQIRFSHPTQSASA